jgi:5-deoxy-D-glucuronate isomerase
MVCANSGSATGETGKQVSDVEGDIEGAVTVEQASAMTKYAGDRAAVATGATSVVLTVAAGKTVAAAAHTITLGGLTL